MTDESHSSARILDVRPIRVPEELDRGRIVVLPGFQGVNPVTKEITTLGRGGSDTTGGSRYGKRLIRGAYFRDDQRNADHGAFHLP
jgi:hypothetical protein